jgi:hypothetical protein
MQSKVTIKQPSYRNVFSHSPKPPFSTQTPVSETLEVNKKLFNYALASSMANGHVNFNLCQFKWKNSHFYPQKKKEVVHFNAETSNHESK